MENRSAIWIFTGLLVAACLYQLSFNVAVNNFEKKAKTECELSDEAVSQAVCEKNYLDVHKLDTIYPVFNHTYQHCKEQQLNLGLVRGCLG